MATASQTYASEEALTITINSLADDGARESTAIDQTADNYVDAMLYVAFTLPVGTIANNQRVQVYGYSGPDNSNWETPATGSDAGVTMPSNHGLPLLATIPTPNDNQVYKQTVKSLALAFGGSLPPYWGVIIVNETGLTISASGNEVTFVGTNGSIA